MASYRLAQYWFPILLGGVLYASLRVGPWSIARRDRLDRLRDIAQRETAESERRMEFAMRQWERKRPGEHSDDATIANPLVDQIDAGALEALDPPFAEVADDGGATPQPTPPPTKPSG